MCHRVSYRQTMVVCLLIGATFVLSGCGLLFGSRGAVATPTSEVRGLVPTFTPTPEGAQAAPAAADTQQQPVAVAASPQQQQQLASPTPLPPAPTATPKPTVAAPQPTPAPKLIIDINIANVRNGPGTDYGLAGTVDQNQAFDIVGKNPEGTWWQFCCVNGQKAWIFGELVHTENAGSVPVAQNIPAPPPVAVAPPPPPAPTNTPAPAAPPSAADPCATIGGDGCKWHVRGGPKFNGNGGSEIKLQLFFEHSGIDGGQPQGSYFVVLVKNGTKLPIGDNVRSIALEKSQGAMGPYNYEYKLGLDQIPDHNVAGNYTMWVLDGNGERDSHDLNFTIPDGQGEVWIDRDQAPT